MLFEVTGSGFDGNSDSTDDRVLWVKAESKAQVEAAVLGLDTEVAELPASLQAVDGDINFRLPGEVKLLQACCKGFMKVGQPADGITGTFFEVACNYTGLVEGRSPVTTEGEARDLALKLATERREAFQVWSAKRLLAVICPPAAPGGNEIGGEAGHAQ